MRDQIRHWAGRAGLGRMADQIESLLMPSIRIRTINMGDDAIPVGASKLGGLPDLPPSVAWPEWAGWPEYRERNFAPLNYTPEYGFERHGWEDGPMSFLAQFRMDDFGPLDPDGLLPTAGMLYVFCAIWVDALGYDERVRGAWRIIHREDDPATLVRTPQPDGLKPLGGSAAWAFGELTLPDVTSSGLPDMDQGERDRYNELLLEQINAEDGGHRPTHRLLGWPQLEQSDPDLYPEADDWRLLLQLGSDHHQKLHWQGGGVGYFYIRESDLKRRHFDGVWCVMQCT